MDVGTTSALFCEHRAPVDDARLIAALAVFSHETRLAMRRAIRNSWWPHAPDDTAKFFLLRGRDLVQPAALAAEAHAHGDLLLVNGSSSLPRAIGPLSTLILWCARSVADAGPCFFCAH